MKRRVGIVFLALLCTIVVCGSYWLLKSKVRVHPDETENLTKIEKIVGRDLDNDYPSTPREVVKFYNKIILSFYTEDYTDEQFEGLLTQARGLMDDELLANNPLDTYRSSVKASDVYKRQEKKEFTRTYQMYVLRKDDAGSWKILTYYQIEKNPSVEEQTN